MKYLKKWGQVFESDDTLQYMKIRYGESTIDECNSMIDDIKDMALEFSDLGFNVSVSYSPLTLAVRDTSPKIRVDIGANTELFDKYYSEITELDSRLREYVKSKGYPCGSNITKPNSDWHEPGQDEYKHYQMSIQK
jgi:hypothetical protein